MATARYQHTIQIPEEVEALWVAHKINTQSVESFSAFIIRLMKKELSEHASA